MVIVLFIHAVLVVGFESIFSRVNEEVGSFELCVSIFTQAALLPMHTNFSFSLNLASVPGTAGIIICITDLAYYFMIFADPRDYDEFTSSNNPLVAFTSDPSTHRQCFDVSITDDGALEDTEVFSLQLSLAGGSNVPVTVNPDESIVEIIDNDCM